MRPNAIKVESVGSYWWFDEDAKEYLRMPKVEGPREKAEWSDHRAGALQDFIWHPYERFRTTPSILIIVRLDGRIVRAPMQRL